MNKKWWKECVVYQIYPISFKDSNGDGKGDLQGIISKLDYLQDLGINVIWICPIYQSPNHDNGYDISDYQQIMDEFGTMDDFDELLAKAHDRDMKIIMDLVVNHTSDEHHWFIESSSSTDNPKRDYYIWHKAQDGMLPNNWGSYFGGSVWEYDQKTDEYYMHLYSKHQPDLNWNNPKMIEDIHNMVHWWLKKGIDGFRMDAIAHIVKAEGLPNADNPDHLPSVQAYQMYSNLEKVHNLLKDLNQRVLFGYDIMTVGETSGLGPEQALHYIGNERHELNMVFQFEHMQLDSVSGGTGKWEPRAWNLLELKNIMSKWQTVLHGKGWNANYWCNHDQPRVVSRFGNDGKFRKESAKMLATFMHTLEGTPYIFQGEEIGMTNVHFSIIDDYRDVETLNYYEEARNRGTAERLIMNAIWAKSRDNARTPMQWDAAQDAGFTTGKPWIKVNLNASEINVAEAVKDPDSIFHYYRKMIALRKQHEVIIYGKYELLMPLETEIYAYTRTLEDSMLLVILNFFEREPTFDWPKGIQADQLELLISNYAELSEMEHESGIMAAHESEDSSVLGRGGDTTGLGSQDRKKSKSPTATRSIKLRPYEARVYKVRL